MADEPNNAHDAYFRHVLEKRENAAGELRAVMPKTLVARVDWDSLELQQCNFVSSELRSRIGDLLFRARIDGHEAFIFVLIEHQSQPHPLMPFRMLEYMVQIWNRYISEHPKANTLPAVFPLVVYASPDGRPWNKSTQLADLIDVDPATRAALADHLPSLRFLLDDLTTADVPTLRARKLPPEAFMMFVLLMIAPGNPHLVEDLTPLSGDIEAVWVGPSGKGELRCLARYILKVSDTSEYDLVPLIERLGPEAREIIMTTADRLRAEGIAEGEAKGRIKERAEMLIELLSIKFGTLTGQTVAAIRSANAEALRVWSRRVLTADSLDEVFQ